MAARRRATIAREEGLRFLMFVYERIMPGQPIASAAFAQEVGVIDVPYHDVAIARSPQLLHPNELRRRSCVSSRLRAERAAPAFRAPIIATT